jgi:hypothetical protein
MTKNYDSKVFSRLNDFSIARERLENSKGNLLELGDIICSHNLYEEVGISLLHKHFDLNPHERLVEKFVDNKFYIKPWAEENCSEITPYLWKAESNHESEEWNYFPLEFAHINDDTAKIKEIAESVTTNHEFLAEMAAKLSELGLADTFGIAVIHRDSIELAEGEIVVETTDETARILTCSATFQASIDPDKLTQTLWTFTPNESLKGARACIAHDKCSHCIGHCVHCINHG